MSTAVAISQYWDTGDPPDYVGERLDSFRDLNPDCEHRVFSEEQANRFLRARFGSREAATFGACVLPAMQADYFRYCVVHADGGVYADADLHCLARLRSLTDRLDGGQIFLSPTPRTLRGLDTTRVWSDFFAFKEPGHPLLALTIEIATANIERRTCEQVWPDGRNTVAAIWLTVGPGVFSLLRFMREWGSFDAFLGSVRGTPAEPFAATYCEVVDRYDRVLEAFEDVRVSPASEQWKWVSKPPPELLPYQRSDSYWKNHTGSILRSPE